jgi:hypothetical protein
MIRSIPATVALLLIGLAVTVSPATAGPLQASGAHQDPGPAASSDALGAMRAPATETPPRATAELPSAAAAPPLAVTRRVLLEPGSIFTTDAAGAVARFRPRAVAATAWSLAISECEGPEVAVLAGTGSVPAEIRWDGRTADGNFARPGMRYEYVLSFRDPTGVPHLVAGQEFTVPAYTCAADSALAVLFAATGCDLATAAPDTALGSCLREAVALIERRRPPQQLRVEVLADDESRANELGEHVRALLCRALDCQPPEIAVYVGTAAAAPADGTVLITSTTAP